MLSQPLRSGRALAVAAVLFASAAASAAESFFGITVVDKDSRAPLPGVRLELVNHVVLLTDANGKAAFHEPGLMGVEVFFTPTLAGYEFPADGFGFRGRKLLVTPGGSATLELTKVGTPQPSTVTSTAQTQLLARSVPAPNEYFVIRAYDQATGRGVPIVEVRAAGKRWFTDSSGRIALFDPDVMNQKVELTVTSPGYVFNGSKITAELKPGARLELPLQRRNIAERLYRVTGAGIYRDTVLLGQSAPTKNPVLNGQVFGQDSVLSAVYKGELFWCWGDTNRPSYPLGHFRVSGGRSKLPAAGGLAPDVGVDLEYFVDANGFSRPMAPASEFPGQGAIWLDGLVSVPNAKGEETLVATWGRFPKLAAPEESGLASFDDAAGYFRKVTTWAATDVVRPDGNPLLFANEEGTFLYHRNMTRVPATAEAYFDAAKYEAYTPLTSSGAVERSGSVASYAWKSGVRPTQQSDVGTAPQKLSPPEWVFGQLRDPDSGEQVSEHSNGYLGWSNYRGRFFRLVMQVGAASSYLGELWYAEADTPMGPWVYARKIVTHPDGYTFYNPRAHPFFDVDGGHTLFFEGTYTNLFSSVAEPTPRYDYNQVMYRLNLDDPRMVLPVPVYRLDEKTLALGTKEWVGQGLPSMRPEFFAYDRPVLGTVPFKYDSLSRLVRDDRPDDGRAAFHAIPGEALQRPATAVPLWEYVANDHRLLYSIDPVNPPCCEAVRQPDPVAYVFPNPGLLPFPTSRFLPPLVADAGPDQTFTADQGVVTVELDGSGSRAVRGGEFKWFRNHETDPFASGVKASFKFDTADRAVGVTRVVLRIDGPDGTSSDELQILLDGPNAEEEPRFIEGGPDVVGCSCSSATAGTPLLLLAALGLLVRRRY